jgi:hypothetical protein
MVQRKFIQPAIDTSAPPVASEFSVGVVMAAKFNTALTFMARAELSAPTSRSTISRFLP